MADVQKLIVNNTDYDIDDPNDVETEGGELADTVINYESATTPTIGSFTQFLDRFTSGTKVGAWFKNFRAGCDFLLHIGSLVNNCVSDNETLPLAAAQGKVLMDLITEANSLIDNINNDLSEYYWSFYGIKQIYNNSDLNDYQSFGNYYCTPNSTAETLVNCPTSYAFNLKVFSGTGDKSYTYITQLLIDLMGNIYIRRCSNGSWRSWNQFATLSDINALENEVAAYKHELDLYKAYDSSSDES